VLELAVATLGRHKKPAVFFDEPDDVSYLHREGGGLRLARILAGFGLDLLGFSRHA
jgi:hypothetical protein